MTTIYLIRHSLKMRLPFSASFDPDRIQPLSAEGEIRAQKLLEVPELRGADTAYCSPFARTISTLRYLVEADSLPLFFDERLRELEFGGPRVPPEVFADPNAPKPSWDIRARQWDDRDLRHDNGESLNQCCARMTEAIRDIVTANEGKTVLVGSHGAAICAYLSSMMEGIGDHYAFSLPMPALFRLVFDGDSTPRITRLPLSDAD